MSAHGRRRLMRTWRLRPSPSCLAGCSRSSRKAVLTCSGLPRVHSGEGCCAQAPGEAAGPREERWSRLRTPLYALGNLDFLRATGIWQLLVRCSSCLRSAVVDSSGRPLLDLFPCSALFGLTVDTCVCQSTEAWACWLRCTSRCVPSWFSGPGALHHGWYGSAGAVCVLVLPGVYRFPDFMEDDFMFPYSELSLYMRYVSLWSGIISCFST